MGPWLSVFGKKISTAEDSNIQPNQFFKGRETLSSHFCWCGVFSSDLSERSVSWCYHSIERLNLLTQSIHAFLRSLRLWRGCYRNGHRCWNWQPWGMEMSHFGMDHWEQPKDRAMTLPPSLLIHCLPSPLARFSVLKELCFLVVGYSPSSDVPSEPNVAYLQWLGYVYSFLTFCCCCSVAQLYLTLLLLFSRLVWYPMDCSMPDFPVLLRLWKVNFLFTDWVYCYTEKKWLQWRRSLCTQRAPSLPSGSKARLSAWNLGLSLSSDSSPSL